MENLVDREDRSQMFEKWSHLNWKEELDLLDYSDWYVAANDASSRISVQFLA